MINPKELIINEFKEADNSPKVSPLLLQLDSHRITLKSEIPDEEFLFKIHGVPCFPRRDLSAVTGQAKSGKTFFMSMLMACATKRNVLALERIRETPLRVMWYDTEQSERSTLDILRNRVSPLCDGVNGAENVYAFNVRSISCEERMDMLTEGIIAYRPDIVILDGIRDLVKDINDGVRATEIIERLMRLAEEYNCNIVCVLHQNKGSDSRGLRGWLGTELTNKVFEVYSCEKQKERGVFCVEQTHTRKFDMEDELYYVVNEAGLPVLVDRPSGRSHDVQERYDSKESPYDSLNREYIIEYQNGGWEWDLRKLFSKAMGCRATWTYNELRNEAMRLSNIKRVQYYNKLFAKAEEERIVKKVLDRCGRVLILLTPAVSNAS